MASKLDYPSGEFEDWDIAAVRKAAGTEPPDQMPGTGRHVPGPMRSLLDALEAHGAQTPAELPDRLRFGLKLHYADMTQVLGRVTGGASKQKIEETDPHASE